MRGISLKVFYWLAMKIFFWLANFEDALIIWIQCICLFFLSLNSILELHYKLLYSRIEIYLFLAIFGTYFCFIISINLWKKYLGLKMGRNNYFLKVTHYCCLEFSQNFICLFSFSCFEIWGLLFFWVNQ